MTINRPFADCKIAELHLADAIQPFGAMVVLDGDGTVAAVSSNVEAFLGVAPQDLLGTDARRSLPEGLDLDEVRAVAADTEGSSPIRLRLREVRIGERTSTAAIHARDGHVIVELQAPKDDDAASGAAVAVVQRLSDRLEEAATPEDAARVLMDAIADVVGFDRVMLYRFLPDWHGEVLAERLAPGVEGFLGLRFPAGDIPANARRLYLAKRQRIIADVRAEPVPVLGVRDGMRLDLAGSEMRAVHPTHLTYLANMGVEASFSVSVVAEGRLWGMIACHHFAPRRLGLVTRQTCEMLTSIASLQVANLVRLRHLRDMEQHRAAIARVRFELEEEEEDHLETLLAELRRVFQADGVLASVRGERMSDGRVPGDATAARLREVVASWPDDAVTAGSEVPAELGDDAEAVRFASGVLHVPFGPAGHVTFLRREEIEHVSWAGRASENGAEGSLNPRSSFAIWQETRRGHAEPWTSADVESAEGLRALLVERVQRTELERRATTDELTGLANRAALEAALADALAVEPDEARRAGRAVLMIDLDHFKAVNDTFGHLVGDELLGVVAERLRAALRDEDVGARLGGDEFVALLHGVGSTSALADAAARVVRSLSAPYRLAGREVEIGASVGATFLAPDGDTVDTVLSRADDALYAAKRAGRGRWVLTSVDLDEETRAE